MFSFKRYLLLGGAGFCAVSLCVFATVAFAERWMYDHLSVLGAYLVWTILFVVLGGASLSPLVPGSSRLLKSITLFGASFFLYAAGWMASYFILRGPAGEWAGSLLGSALMGFVMAAGFKAWRSTPKVIAELFVANSLGYFIGSALNDAVSGRTGMLLWGAAYGLFLGAGLGAALFLVQSPQLHAATGKQA